MWVPSFLALLAPFPAHAYLPLPPPPPFTDDIIVGCVCVTVTFPLPPATCRVCAVVCLPLLHGVCGRRGGLLPCPLPLHLCPALPPCHPTLQTCRHLPHTCPMPYTCPLALPAAHTACLAYPTPFYTSPPSYPPPCVLCVCVCGLELEVGDRFYLYLVVVDCVAYLCPSLTSPSAFYAALLPPPDIGARARIECHPVTLFSCFYIV